MSEETKTIDHVWPRSKWPSDAAWTSECAENLAPCCRTCQRLKGDRVLAGIWFDRYGALVVDWDRLRLAVADLRARRSAAS